MPGFKYLDNFQIRTTNRAWADFLAFAVILGLFNMATVGLADWGWLSAKMNPSPWLLIPLFIGVRYGFGPGVTSGLVVMAIVFLGRAARLVSSGDAAPLLSIFQDNAFFFICLPAIGFLAGETHGLLAKKLIQAEEKIAELSETHQQLQAKVELAEESRHQVQERLALFGAEQSSLDRQLRALFEPTAGPIFPNLLRLLRDIGGVTDAGIYAVEGKSLRRLAVVGDEQRCPKVYEVADLPIAQLSIERRAMTTLKEVWQQTPDSPGPVVAALPWLGGDGVAALLLIHRMQFMSTTWRNLHRIQLVCRWVGQFVDLRVQAEQSTGKLAGKTGALVVPEQALENTLKLAVAAHKDWNLPSAMAIFEFQETVPQEVAELLPKAVGSVLRPTDVGCLTDEAGKSVFKVLLPMDGAAEGEALLGKALAAIAKVPQLSGKIVANLALTENTPQVA
jgi:hypothetical protein